MLTDRTEVRRGVAPTPEQVKRRRRVAGAAFFAAVGAVLALSVPGSGKHNNDTERAKPSIEPPAQGYNAEQLNSLTEADIETFEDPDPKRAYTVQEGDTPESVADEFDHRAVVTSTHARELIIGAITRQAKIPGVLVAGQSLRPPQVPVNPDVVPLTGAEAANNAAQVAPQASNTIRQEVGGYKDSPSQP